MEGGGCVTIGLLRLLKGAAGHIGVRMLADLWLVANELRSSRTCARGMSLGHK